MTTINVQFSDSTKSTIISAFSCPQDSEVYPNQGQVDATDPMWHTYYADLPASSAQFAIAPE